MLTWAAKESNCEPVNVAPFVENVRLGVGRSCGGVNQLGHLARDGEKRPSMSGFGRTLGGPSRNRETNRESGYPSNYGQYGTYERSVAVNKRRANRCGKKDWLPESNTDPNTVVENAEWP